MVWKLLMACLGWLAPIFKLDGDWRCLVCHPDRNALWCSMFQNRTLCTFPLWKAGNVLHELPRSRKYAGKQSSSSLLLFYYINLFLSTEHFVGNCGGMIFGITSILHWISTLFDNRGYSLWHSMFQIDENLFSSVRCGFHRRGACGGS